MPTDCCTTAPVATPATRLFMLNNFEVIESAALLILLATDLILLPTLLNAVLIFEATFCAPEPKLLNPDKTELAPDFILDKPDFILSKVMLFIDFFML